MNGSPRDRSARILLLTIGATFVGWPLIYDQFKSSCRLTHKACLSAEPTAFYIIIASIIIGSLFLAVAICGKKGKLSANLPVLGLTVGLSAMLCYAYYVVALGRSLQF